MGNTIYGIPIIAGSGLSQSETKKIIGDLVQAWAWEGRQLGKAELISDGQFVPVCSYEKPFVTVIPLSKAKRSVK